LDIENPAVTLIKRTDIRVIVELQGNTDECSDGIGKFLGELFGAMLLFHLFGRRGRQAREEEGRQERMPMIAATTTFLIPGILFTWVSFYELLIFLKV
jgi:hypothetical protein